jgi:hypothetical protein
MANPTRFPAGISTFRTSAILNTFPNVPNDKQSSVLTTEMNPYTAGSYTVTNTTATIGAGTGLVGFNAGIISLAVTTASGGKAAVALNGNSSTGQAIQLIPGNQMWFNIQVAHNSTFLSDSTTVARYGLFDVSDTTGTITNGVYLEKAAGGTALNLIIKNTGLTGSTVTTTINNVADLAKPSGIYGDTSSTVGTLTTAGSSNKYTSVAVNAAGSGYAQAPLVRATGANGSSPYAQLYCQTQSNSLYAPYIAHVGGTGYTTFTNEVNHWIDLSMYYDGKGHFYFGVNGKQVLSIGQDGATALAAGGTATTGNTFFATNASMTTSIAPVLPTSGAFDNIMPMVALNAAAGYALNTNATNIMFIDSFQAGSEYN